jgi:hypothetical protein
MPVEQLTHISEFSLEQPSSQVTTSTQLAHQSELTELLQLEAALTL